jgi:scyllo-inositol 2-dehydrogenase (NAD+)
VETKRKLNVGLIGLGRLGRVYARDLSGRIPCTRLVAVADIDSAAVEEVSREFDVPRGSTDPADVIDDPAVDAVVIVTPTATHRAVTEAAVAAGKAIFCEKPLSISLEEAEAIRQAVRRSGVFFQMGFMRRFDRGFAAAKERLDAGDIGDAVVFKSTSRDPFRPSLEYADPRSSGGLIIDMGIHDFDLARWYMGEVAAVHAVGGVLAYPELATVGDIDNAVMSLVFTSGRLGVIDITRNGYYGYDISAELLGTQGHAARGLPARDAAHGDDEERGDARHRAVLHGALPRRLHGAARELRAERAARPPAAHHRGRWGGGAAGGARGNPGAEDRRARRGRVDRAGAGRVRRRMRNAVDHVTAAAVTT